MTGPELKARRKELGLKLKDVAHALGIKHIQQVSEWERGDVRPGSKHLVNLAKVLQVSISDLIATPPRSVANATDSPHSQPVSLPSSRPPTISVISPQRFTH